MTRVLLLVCLLLLASKADAWRRRRRSPPPPPPPDTTAPTLHNCPSSLGNRYTTTSTARVTWTAPTCSDARSSCTVTRTSGAASGSQFSEGSHTIAYRAVDTSGNARACSFRFTVVVIRCSTLGQPASGSVGCTNSRSVGSVCQSSCNTGYRLSGSASRTCVQSSNSAYWSGSTVSCTRITCSPTLTSPSNSVVSCTDSRYFNSICSYTCRSGYTRTSGSSQRTCTASGWSGTTAQCQDVTPPLFVGCPASQSVYAPDLQTTAVAQWAEPGVTDTTGQSISPSRTSGPASGSSFPAGVNSIVYNAFDVAGNQAATCTFSVTVNVIYCSALSSTLQGRMSCPDGTIRGSLCSFSCNTGYVVVGSTSSSCRLVGSSGSWSHPAPSCNLLKCPIVNAPSNGKFVGTCSTNYGSSCRFDCNVGYAINNDQIRCSAQPGSSTAYWEGSMPYCSIIKCTKPTLTSGLQLPASSSCPTTTDVPYGSRCTFTCSHGYHLQGNQVLSCLSDGSWDHSTPSCQTVTCTSSDIPAPTNGVKTGCSNAVETYGTVCTITCNVGYLPDTPVYSTCGDDGTGSGVWDSGPVTCSIVMCTALGNPTNGGISKCLYEVVPQNIPSAQRYSTVCSLNCNNGFTRTSGSASRTCMATGTWDGADTVCDDITPPVLTCPLDREIVAENGTVFGTLPWHKWEPLKATDAGSEIVAHLASIDSIPVITSPTSLIEGSHHITYDVLDPAGNGQTCSFDVTTRVIRCPGLPLPRYGRVHLNSGQGDCVAGAVYGSSCGFRCGVGYQLSTGYGNFSRTCLRNSASDLVGYWDAYQPTCLIKNCTLPSVTNGHSPDCLTAAVGYGTNCEFECDRGYTTPTAVDRVNRSCQADTTWGGSDMSCSVVITCSAQLSLDHGHVEPSACSTQTAVRFDTECEYSCDSGFLLHGPVKKRCNPDGNWNDLREPHCEDIQNPVFTDVCPVHIRVDAERGTMLANVTLVPPGAQDNSGSVNVSRVGSSDTMFHEGSTTVSYIASDASGNEARCDVIVTITVYRCSMPKAPVDGAVTNCSDLFYGSICSFICDIGHDLIGSETLTCDLTQGVLGPNATWNEPFPTCQIRTCIALRLQPPAIKVGCDKNPPLTEDYGTVCTLICPYGYRGVGESRSVCDDSGDWSSTHFTCERTPCPPLRTPSDMTITPSSCTMDPRFGDTCTLQCSRSGFEVNPKESSSVTCSGNERWTKNIVSTSCKDVEPPIFTQCPNDFVRHPGLGSTTTFVSWTVAATDNDAIGLAVSCDHPSNASMLVGKHHVTCLASDRSGNSEVCSFIVTVEVRQCPQLVLPLFGALNGSCDTAYGSSCHVICGIGYHLNGSSSAFCDFNGTDMYWSWDVEPSCEANWCPPIALPSMIAVHPDSCSRDAEVAVGTFCTFSCPPGLSLVVNATALMCLIDGQWDRHIEEGSLTCQDNSSPVITSCPGIIHANRTQYWGVEVTFVLPTAQDNFDPHLDVVTDPVDLESPYNFTINTACGYTFTDDSGNTATCDFDVLIKDLVEPSVLYCPPNQNMTTSKQMTMVTWDEPVVQDIPGDDVIVTCNYDTNQIELPWGNHDVVYRATNLNNGFTINCSFTVSIEPLPCSELHTPLHGALSCDTWLFRRYCSMSCDESYDIPRPSSMHQPTTLYVCGFSGLWSPHAYVADCSETKYPRRSHLQSAMQYHTGTCETLMTTEDIAKAFISILNGSIFRDACHQEDDCKIENVAVSCGSASARSMFKRSPGILRRRKRSPNQKIDKDLDFMRQMLHGNDLEKDGPTIIYLDIAINNKPDKVLSSGLELEDKLLSMARGIGEKFRLQYNLTSMSMTSGYSVIQCDDGYVPDHESLKCVACTTGHFYDKASSVDLCSPCSYGYYQDRQAQVTCRKCPVGQSTERKGSRSIGDCKDMCPSGQFSHTGLHPCVKCPRDSFQPMKGQTSCFHCSGGSVTLHTGSSSPDQCIKSYKDNVANNLQEIILTQIEERYLKYNHQPTSEMVRFP